MFWHTWQHTNGYVLIGQTHPTYVQIPTPVCFLCRKLPSKKLLLTSGDLSPQITFWGVTANNRHIWLYESSIMKWDNIIPNAWEWPNPMRKICTWNAAHLIIIDRSRNCHDPRVPISKIEEILIGDTYPRPKRTRFPCVAFRSVTIRRCIYVDASWHNAS